MTQRPGLREQLAGDRIVVAPGVYDGLGALLAERAGFGAVYLSGASIAYGRFGRPDIGLVAMTEVAATLSVISERTTLPIVADADTGYGNALNVMRTVTLFERSGAAAIQIEDQTMPKRCGHLAGKSLVPAAEMVGKIKAALDARADAATVIIARTDAIAVEGFDRALDRAERYLDAGADMLFVEAPRTREELAAAAGRFAGRAPMMANMVEGGRTPMASAEELDKLGYALVIFPSGLVRAVARLAEDYMASLKEHGSNDPFGPRMLDFDGINALVGTSEILAIGRRYDMDNFDDGGD